MGKITAIEPQARHANRFNLYVDNRFVLGISAIVAARLRNGETLTEEDLKNLEQEETFETAYEKALRFLEPRPRSTNEVKQHLLKKKTAGDVAERVLARLNAAGLLNDRAFAKYWVENRERFRPRAGRALRFELKQKGLSTADVERAVGQIDESESAYRAGAARADRWRDLDRHEFMEKLTAFLVRRGFSFGVGKETAARLWNETREPKS